MITLTDDRPRCFGFFFGDGHQSCSSCLAARRCKALLISDVFDIVAEITEGLVEDLPVGAYKDTRRPAELVKVLIDPKKSGLTDEEAQLLGLLNSTSNVGNIQI